MQPAGKGKNAAATANKARYTARSSVLTQPTKSELEQYKGKLEGKIVLVSSNPRSEGRF